MAEEFSQLRVEDHLEDTVEAEFVGATLAMSSDNEGILSSREDLTRNPEEGKHAHFIMSVYIS